MITPHFKKKVKTDAPKERKKKTGTGFRAGLVRLLQVSEGNRHECLPLFSSYVFAFSECLIVIYICVCTQTGSSDKE